MSPKSVAVLAVLLFATSVVTSAGQGSAKSKRLLPGSTFSESELERYKVTLKPEVPDSGVGTGILIVNGYYIPPPYRITVHDGQAYVNGVQVYPTPRPVPPPRDEEGLRAYATSEAGQISFSLGRVAESGVELYQTRLATGMDTATALRAAESLMKAQPTVRGVGFSTKFQCVVYGPVGTWPSGRSEQVRYGFFFPRQRRPRPSAHITPDSVARMMGGALAEMLERGAVKILGGGHDRTSTKAGLADVVRVMTTRDLSPSQRWERLLKELGPAQAYMCVANYEASRQGWDRLAAKLGVKP